jgi:hypothetical protein
VTLSCVPRRAVLLGAALAAYLDDSVVKALVSAGLPDGVAAPIRGAPLRLPLPTYSPVWPSIAPKKRPSVYPSAPAPSTPALRVRLQTAPALRPMPLLRLPEPFDHPDWLFEVKHDGFRALAHIDGHHCSRVAQRPHLQALAAPV